MRRARGPCPHPVPTRARKTTFGRRLAFVGAMDGPTSDVYVLETATWRVTRVSAEPTHVIRLSWSPDGRWILHEGAAASRRAGGSAGGEVTYVSAADGSSESRVWGGSGIGSWLRAWPDAWLGEHEAILHAEGNGCGICAVVHVDAATGITRTLIVRHTGFSSPVCLPRLGGVSRR